MQEITTLLQNEFVRRKSGNPQFSKRAFAQKLGLSSGSLVEILSGRRKVSRKLLVRICNRLGVHPEEVIAPTAPLTGRQLLPLDQFELIARLEHFHLLNLMELKKGPHRAENLAARLGLSPARVNTALRRLESLGLAKKNRAGTWSRCARAIDTPEDTLSPAIQQAHREALALAETKLELAPEERDFSLIISAGSRSQLPLIKKKIREFQDQLQKILDSGPRDEILQLNFQVFPVTKTNPTPGA